MLVVSLVLTWIGCAVCGAAIFITLAGDPNFGMSVTIVGLLISLLGMLVGQTK
jgi:hypothetical protein